MFNVGDTVRAVETDSMGRLVVGQEYTVNFCRDNTIQVVGIQSFFLAKRFAKARAALAAIRSRRGSSYTLSVERPTGSPINPKAIKDIRLYREAAARLYRFDPNAGRRIRQLRASLSQGDDSYYCLCNKKYDIKLMYSGNEMAERKKTLARMREAIRNKRRELSALYHDESSTGYCRECKVHHYSSGVLNAYCEKFLTVVTRPTTLERHIGIEIECFVPNAAARSAFLPLASFVNLAEDGSIRPDAGYEGIEVRVLSAVSNFEERLTQVCGVLEKLKAKVNRSCGLHVHIDMRGLPVEEVNKQYNNLVRAQKFLRTLVRPERHTSTYCRPSQAGNPYSQRNRYRAINACSLSNHGTIEVRLHEGTTDPAEIINWIKVLLRITASEPMLRACASVGTFSRKIKLEPELIDYMTAKAALLAPVPDTEPVSLPRETVDCRIHHNGETCVVCHGTWDYHTGHACEHGGRGRFEGCQTVEETANV